jgi:hypothetical protein
MTKQERDNGWEEVSERTIRAVAFMLPSGNSFEEALEFSKDLSKPRFLVRGLQLQVRGRGRNDSKV